MTNPVVYIRKTRSTRSTWAYLSPNSGRGTIIAPDGDLTVQMAFVVDSLRVELGSSALTIVSPQMNKVTQQEMEVFYDDCTFMPIVEHSVQGFFDRAFTQPVARRRSNQNTKYLASDSSGGHHSNHDKSQFVPASWAWCSDGVDGSYDFGFSGDVNVNVSELEGIMNAVVANADAPVNRLHVFSDSANAVDMFNYDLAEGIVPREARKHGLVPLAKEAMQVAQHRNITVEWVKGHRQHRLNNIADVISRLARKRFASGLTADEFTHEADALYAVFNRSA